jgi:2'-hydroxyisoflavone reductase
MADLSALHDRTWDAVIDTCGYFPRAVRHTAEALVDRVEQYIFISSISVYADFTTPDVDENSPLATLADVTVEEITGETYGGLKALCEHAVNQVFPGRALNVRAGLIVGPHDQSDRFTYWVSRMARGGDVLVPDFLDCLVQAIDVRDLSEWIVHMAETRTGGAYNVTGPQHPYTLEFLLTTAQSCFATPANLLRVSEDFLLAHEVRPWIDLPLWIPSSDPDVVGFSRVSIRKALATGLLFRPLAQTLLDTLSWAQSRSPEHTWRAGLSATREAELLTAWGTSSGTPQSPIEPR